MIQKRFQLPVPEKEHELMWQHFQHVLNWKIRIMDRVDSVADYLDDDGLLADEVIDSVVKMLDTFAIVQRCISDDLMKLIRIVTTHQSNAIERSKRAAETPRPSSADDAADVPPINEERGAESQ